MIESDPNYTKCTIEELFDVQRRIDRKAYPDRAAAVDREIARRHLECGHEHEPPAPVPVRLAEPIAVKPGRAPSLMGALASVGISIIGVVMLFKAVREGDWYQILFLVVFCLIAFSGLYYSLHNAFGRNRFTERDLVSPQQEPDALATALGYEPRPAQGTDNARRRFPGDHCPYCGAQADRTVDYCPSCGKDI